MKIIRISTNNEISVHDFPEGNHTEQNRVLRELIGDGCCIYEHVMPRRLYTDLHMKNRPTRLPGQCVSMLVDEEGGLKEGAPNLIGSYLYETDKHGYPIMGNVFFVGEQCLKGQTLIQNKPSASEGYFFVSLEKALFCGLSWISFLSIICTDF